jgi:hypothetical protein
MKKRFLFAVVAVVLVVALAACTGNTGKDDGNKVEIESSTALINSVWTTYAEEEKFPVMGGDFSAPVDNGAGEFNISDVENAVATLHITEDSLQLVDKVGTITHAMNANTFSAAAYHLADAANAETLVNSLKDSIKSTQWMCGFPDTLIIYTVADEYVVAAFGNAEAIERFKTKLATVYGEGATLNVEESLA